MTTMQIGAYTVDRDARTITVESGYDGRNFIGSPPLFDSQSVYAALLEAADTIHHCREEIATRREVQIDLADARRRAAAHGTYELSAVDEHGAHLHTIKVRF
jgi:hypothetical protein